MPLTEKGKKIMRSMIDEYGKKKGKTVFYASKNKGTIKGVEKNGALLANIFRGIPKYAYALMDSYQQKTINKIMEQNRASNPGTAGFISRSKDAISAAKGGVSKTAHIKSKWVSDFEKRAADKLTPQMVSQVLLRDKAATTPSPIQVAPPAQDTVRTQQTAQASAPKSPVINGGSWFK